MMMGFLSYFQKYFSSIKSTIVLDDFDSFTGNSQSKRTVHTIIFIFLFFKSDFFLKDGNELRANKN